MRTVSSAPGGLRNETKLTGNWEIFDERPFRRLNLADTSGSTRSRFINWNLVSGTWGSSKINKLPAQTQKSKFKMVQITLKAH